MQRKTYIHDGANLVFYDSIQGSPVVSLHPTPLDHSFWNPLIDQLEGVRAIVPDLRGHGGSELGDHLPVGAFTRVPDAPTLTVGQLATDTLALMDSLDIRSAIFIGCSIGGYTMLELWRQAPQRMRGLGFICSKPQPDAESNLVKRAETIAKARAGGKEILFDGMTQSLIGATARSRRPDLVAEIRAQMALTEEAIVAIQAGLAIRPDSMPTVSTITVPVLGLAGGEDTVITPREMEAFQAALGECTLHSIPDAGHFAAYEQPREVAEVVMNWLRAFTP
jgi:3-oxoadipate enol-lactonase